MKLIYNVFIFFSLLLFSCNSKPSLQQYFVENTDNKNFISLDVSPTILNLDKTKLSVEQSKALQSFDKMNVLAFKMNDKNKTQFDIERAKVTTLLKDEKYQQLMKYGSGKEGASISYVGTDEHIEEFVLFANQKETGFAVIRVLGKDMNPTSIVKLVSSLQKANIDLSQLKPLLEMVNKK